MNSQRLSIRIDPKLEHKLRHEAAARRKPTSEIVREALERHLGLIPDNEENCYDLALKSGFIGCTKTATKDLSTNKKHFEGFGSR